MKKDLSIIGGLLLLVFALIIFGNGLTSIHFAKNDVFKSVSGASSLSATKADVNITVNNLIIRAKIASTDNLRKRGLSKIESLPINQGMLFVFEQKGKYSFWMKDMKFPIDIIWIDENKRIVTISKNAFPEPKTPDKNLKIYQSNFDVKFVLEINAGLSDANDIKIGDVVSFSL